MKTVVALCPMMFYSFLAAASIVVDQTGDLAKLFAEADLVCRVVSLDAAPEPGSQGNTSRMPRPVSVMVERVYKGNLAPSARIAIHARQAWFWPPRSLERGHILVFLKTVEGQYVLDGRFTAAFPVSSSRSQQSGNEGWLQLESDLKEGLEDPDTSLRLQSLRLLGGMRKLTSMAPIVRLSEDPDPELRGTAILALLRNGDPSAIRKAADFIDSTEPLGSVAALHSRMAFELEQFTSPGAASELLELARSSNRTLRSASVRALRFMQDPSAVPALVSRLDDTDPEIRYDAMMGLASITHRGPAPAMDLFLADPALYIAAWKQWWELEGRATYEH